MLEPSVFDYLTDDTTVFEKEPLENLAKVHQLNAYKYNGFWRAMDTLRDKIELTKMWSDETAPWALWKK